MIIKNQKGGAAVEFAIVLPLLVMFVAGIIEFSICFYNKQVITAASREAVRAGINKIDSSKIPDPDAYLKGIVNVYCFGNDDNADGQGDHPRLITFGNNISEFSLGSTPPCIEINDGSGYDSSLQDLKVSVAYIYNFLIPSFIGVGSSITLEGQTIMRMF